MVSRDTENAYVRAMKWMGDLSDGQSTYSPRTPLRKRSSVEWQQIIEDWRKGKGLAPFATNINVTDDARRMGIHIVGGKGSGKSRLMGRGIIYHDFMRTDDNAPAIVVIDPHGPTIDNFLDRITWLPRELQEALTERIIYVDMSGQNGYVQGFPLYYRLHGDSLRTVAKRFVSIVIKNDPNLTRAPYLGENSIEEIGINAGMVLYALGLQVDALPSLLGNTKSWTDKLNSLLKTKAAIAARYFLEEYPKEPASRKSSIKTKLIPFTHDDTIKAMFCCPQPTIDWDQIIEQKKVVLFDFAEEEEKIRRFKILWTLMNVLEYIKRRGATRDASPISLVIDELASLVHLDATNDLLSADLDDLINRVARNNNIWLTIAHQEMRQLPQSIQDTMMTMGVQVIGGTTKQEVALDYARQFSTYDPKMVKKTEPILMNVETIPGTRLTPAIHEVRIVGHRTFEFTPDEQIVLASRKFRSLKQYHFLVSVSPEEGTFSTDLHEISIANLDCNEDGTRRYVNEPLVKEVKQGLAMRDGLPIDELLAVLENRLDVQAPPLLVGKATAQPRKASRASRDIGPG